MLLMILEKNTLCTTRSTCIFSTDLWCIQGVTTPTLTTECVLHTCLCPYKDDIAFSNPQPGLILTLHCNRTPGFNPRWCGARGHSLSSRVIISLASSAPHNSCHCPAASNNFHWGTHASHFTDGNRSIAPTWDDLYTEFIQPHRSVDYADKYLHVCLARTPPAPALRFEPLSQNEQWLWESWLHGAQVCPCASPSHHITAVAGQ